MPAGRPKPPLTLGPEDRQTLSRWTKRAKTSQALALRARIVLRAAEGLASCLVARQLEVSEGTVGKWRQRFLRQGLAGLLDEPRSGAPRRISDDQVEAVVVKTLESTPRDRTHWSTRSMAQASGLSDTSVLRIWRAFGLQPHRTETFKLSTDPLLIGTHKTPLIRNWFAKRPRFQVHFTPTSGSWLTLVERWFAELTNKQLRRGVHRRVAQLKTA